MAKLIWKEYREIRVSAILLTACAIGLVIFAEGYTFPGALEATPTWMWLSTALALIIGFKAFSPELSIGVAEFLYSRPVWWGRILMAKLAAGLLSIALAALAAAVTYLIVRPLPYADTITASSLATGIGYALLLMVPAYLIGFCCSVVLPGIIGGMLVLAGSLVLLTLQVIAFCVLAPDTSIWTPVAWFGAIAAAAVLTAHFGLTLHVGARETRYGLTAALVLLAISTANSISPWDFGSRILPPDVKLTSISPDGNFAVMWVERLTIPPFDELRPRPPVGRIYMMDLKNQNTQRLELRGSGFWWMQPDTAYTYDHIEGKIRIFRMDERGRIMQSCVDVNLQMAWIRPSPDGRYAVVYARLSNRPNVAVVVDIAEERILPLRLEYTRDEPLWLSNTEIGYVDAEGNRHVIDVLDY